MDSVERAVRTMWDRYDERLSLDAMAGSVYLSRFYFSRLFRSRTGTSPGRFLTAVRLYEAKRLLVETDLTVTDVACGVGYQSLGTFISRFSRSVGVSPTRYRWLARHGDLLLPAAEAPPHRGGTVAGQVTLPPVDVPVKVYVSVFDTPIVQGRPTSCDVLTGPGPYVLRDVPEGRWHLRAAAIAIAGPDSPVAEPRPVAVGAAPPVTVTAGAVVAADLELRPAGPCDLPILVVLPELDGRPDGDLGGAAALRPPDGPRGRRCRIPRQEGNLATTRTAPIG